MKQNSTVIIRNIAQSDGTVTTALPASLVEDSPTLLALYIPAGTPFKDNWVIPPEQRAASVDNITPSSQRNYRTLTWRSPTLRLYLPGRFYSIWLNFTGQFEFQSWYGNLEAPFERTPIGIDSQDYGLDLVGGPAGNWRWKDTEEFQRRLEVGLDSPAHQQRVRNAGEQLLDAFNAGRHPFDRDWRSWRPNSLKIPSLDSTQWQTDFGTAKRLLQYRTLNGPTPNTKDASS